MSASSPPLTAPEILKLHREMQIWMSSTGYTMTEKEQGAAFSMQNQSTLVGFALGIATYGGIRKYAPRLASARPAWAVACGAAQKWAAIPAVFVYLAAYRDFQLFMLPIFYNNLMKNSERTPLSLKVSEVVNGMRGNSNVPVAAASSSTAEPVTKWEDPWAKAPDPLSASANDPWAKPPVVAADDPWAKPPASVPGSDDPWAKPPVSVPGSNDPWIAQPRAATASVDSPSSGWWSGPDVAQDCDAQRDSEAGATWEQIRARQR